MRFALSLIEEGGIESLRRELELRGATRINPYGRFAELDREADIDAIMAHAIKQVFITSVAAIHDAYGIGPKRMQGYFGKFDEGTRLLIKGLHGGALWTDYQSSIRDIYGVTLSANTHGVIIKQCQKQPEGS